MIISVGHTIESFRTQANVHITLFKWQVCFISIISKEFKVQRHNNQHGLYHELLRGQLHQEVPKNPRRALHLSGSEARFGGVG